MIHNCPVHFQRDELAETGQWRRRLTLVTPAAAQRWRPIASTHGPGDSGLPLQEAVRDRRDSRWARGGPAEGGRRAGEEECVINGRGRGAGNESWELKEGEKNLNGVQFCVVEGVEKHTVRHGPQLSLGK